MKAKAKSDSEVREHLITAGVKNLKEFGYEHVNKENITTDRVYRAFFLSMLKDNIGTGGAVDRVIHKLIAEIEGQAEA